MRKVGVEGDVSPIRSQKVSKQASPYLTCVLLISKLSILLYCIFYCITCLFSEAQSYKSLQNIQIFYKLILKNR